MTSPIEQCTGLEPLLDGRLDGEDRHRFEHHLHRCAQCRAATETWGTVKREYSAWVAHVSSDGVENGRKREAQAFVTLLLASLEAGREVPQVPRRKGRWRYPVAAAAAILLGLSLMVYFVTDYGPPVPPPLKTAAPTSSVRVIPAMVFTGSEMSNIAFKGGEAPLIEAPANGRVLATINQDRIGLEHTGKVRLKASTPQETAIRLMHGRAAFEVAPRPPGTHFTVTAGDVTVAVVGTRFSVSTDDGRKVTICVEEGNVSVHAANWRIDLGPGSAVTVEAGTPLPVQTASAEAVATLTTLLSDKVARSDDDGTALPVPPPPSERRPRAPTREPAATPQKDLDGWRALIIGGEAAAAATKIRAFLRVSPRDVDALMLLANCQKRAGEYPNALETYKRVVASGDDRLASRARYLAAELSFGKLGDLRGAVALFEDYLQHTPPNTPNRADARLMQAEALLGIGANRRAGQILKGIVEEYGRTPIANRARKLLGQVADEVENRQ